MIYEYLFLFISLFLLDQNIGRITLEFLYWKGWVPFLNLRRLKMYFTDSLKKKRKQKFRLKIFVKPRIFGCSDVTNVS